MSGDFVDVDEDLVRCPFCGHDEPALWAEDNGTKYVRCGGCGCDGPPSSGQKSYAIRLWNERVPADGKVFRDMSIPVRLLLEKAADQIMNLESLISNSQGNAVAEEIFQALHQARG